jgi:hypothetical protein
MKKVLASLLAVLFVVSLTAMAASTMMGFRGGGRMGGFGHDFGHGCYSYYGGYGDWGSYGCYSGYGWVNGAWVCPAYGYPYIWTWKYVTWSHVNSISMKTKTANDKNCK